MYKYITNTKNHLKYITYTKIYKKYTKIYKNIQKINKKYVQLDSKKST